jgi:hypothetical protein
VVVGVVVLLAVAVVVLPGVIDWNDYKGPIQAQLRGLTGRNVVIGGDIHVAVLPAPAIIANGVRMANVEGASAAGRWPGKLGFRARPHREGWLDQHRAARIRRRRDV